MSEPGYTPCVDLYCLKCGYAGYDVPNADAAS